MIRIKRAYEAPEPGDGTRILIDHLWPRGVKRENLSIKEWDKEVAPSNELRTWFGHDPAKWEEFRRRYFAELDKKPEAWQPIQEAARSSTVTLVYGTKETRYNNAVALKAYLEKHNGGDKNPKR